MRPWLLSLVFACACGSSAESSSRGDGGRDGNGDASSHGEGSPGDDADGSTDGATTDGSDAGWCDIHDGMTGRPCATDSDCPCGGAGATYRCTSDAIFGSSGGDAIYPTPVCVDVSPCDPGHDGNPHFCDGPDAPTAPGLCVATGTAGVGVCLPQCTFRPDGHAPSGCQGKDACLAAGFGSDAAGNLVGYGYCFGGCSADADCGAGQRCQLDQGICVGALVTGSPPGASCAVTGAPTSPASCDCVANASTKVGYCAQFCVTGASGCATGTVCDAELPRSVAGPGDAAIPGWTTSNPGMAGFCAPSCAIDGGGAACPAGSACRTVDVAGPVCLP